MAATGGDAETQDLSFVFKSLGQRGQEGAILKEHTEYVSRYFFQHLSELINNKYENNIIFRHYGSTAEDLKCPQPNDIGDEDIVIFPNSDNLIIHDDLIEYLPENPLHVRIKGVDHPVLQSCLVEGTGYVATAALKNFHSAIYGSFVPHLVDYSTRTLQVMSRENIFNGIWEWKNSPKSPALTVDYAHSNGSIIEQLEKQKDPKNLANLDVSEWEWMAHDQCTARGIEYTREHAQVINDYFQYVNEVQIALNKSGQSGSHRMFPDIVQELLWSDRAETLKARYRYIDRRSQNESSKTKNPSVAAERKNNQQCVTPANCDDDESERNEENCSQGTLPSNDGPYVTPVHVDENQRSAKDLECTSSRRQSAKRASPEFLGRMLEKQATENKGVDERRREKQTVHRDGNDNQNPSKVQPEALAQQGQQTCNDLPRNQGNCYKEDEEKEIEKRIHDRWYKHLFETATDAKAEAPSKGTKFKNSKKAQLHDMIGGFDFVPTLRCQGWPKVSRDWMKRERKWPSPQIVDKIVQDGFHLVVKPPKNGGNPECDFRLSFSHAEYLLSQEMNGIQRECYRCLKKYHRAYLSTVPVGLVTFHLKNILLQTIEETGTEMWTESNRTKCMMKLLGNLFEALAKKDLRHFFVRSYNLFGEDYIESPQILESLAEKVEQIIESPVRFTKELMQHQEDATRGKTKEDVPRTKPTTCEKTGAGMEQREKKETPFKQKTETTNQGGASSRTSLRFHDLKDIFLATSKELIDKAFNNAEIGRFEALEPLERSLVEDLREMKRKHNLPVEVFPLMFEGECWDMAYYKVWISTEPNMRRRMLAGIQGVVETWKYILQQDDFGTGNEEAITTRMLDPSSENPFDLSHVLPTGAGTQFLNRLVNSVKPRPYQPQVMDDDIPLD